MNRNTYLWALVLKGLSLGSIFLAQALMARLMSLSDFGFWGYTISLLNIASCITIWGADKFLVRRASVDSELNKLSELASTVRNCYLTILVNTAIIAPLMLWVMFSRFQDRMDISLALIACLLLLVSALARSSSAVTRGLGHPLSSEFSLNCLRPISLMILAITYWTVTPIFSPLAGLVVAVGSYLASIVFTSRLNAKYLSSRIRELGLTARQIYKASFPFLIIGVGITLLANIDIVMLGSFKEGETVARYLASARISELVTSGMVAANMLIAPHLPPLLLGQTPGPLIAVVRRHNKFVSLVTLLPLLLLFWQATFVLGAFGPEYSEGTRFLKLLLLGPTITVFCGPSNLLCMMGKEQKSASFAFLVACIIEIACCYLLIPSFGGIGAAWAKVLAFLSLNLMLVYIVVARVGINPTLINLLVRPK